MANNPKKIVDPTEAALSAIQEALKVRDGADLQDDRTEDLPEPPVRNEWPESPALDRRHAYERSEEHTSELQSPA